MAASTAKKAGIAGVAVGVIAAARPPGSPWSGPRSAARYAVWPNLAGRPSRTGRCAGVP
ncbi:hypothetical protein ACFQ9X_48905 [Catenulispora yoronensis]